MLLAVDELFALWQEPVDAREDAEGAFRRLYADPVSVNGTPVPVSWLVERARALQRALSGLTIDLVDHLETADRVVVVFYMRARHTGPLVTSVGTVAPTGRDIEVRTIDVLTVGDGLIRKVWVSSDELGMLTQLDAVRL
jgi:ketosteroid isomerase-like protein